MLRTSFCSIRTFGALNHTLGIKSWFKHGLLLRFYDRTKPRFKYVLVLRLKHVIQDPLRGWWFDDIIAFLRKPFKTFKRQRSLKYILGDYIQFLGVDEGACASRKRRRKRREESTIFFDFFGGAKDSIFCHTGPASRVVLQSSPFFAFL